MVRITSAASVCLALLLAGCGVPDAYKSSTSVQRAKDPAAHVDAPERPVNPTADSAPAPGSPTSPGAVARAFALQWANWTPQTVARQARRMAALATPTYARVLSQSAAGGASVAGSNRATVIAVAVTPHGDRADVVLVTRETPVSDQAIETPGYHVYLGTLERVAGPWRVASWSQKS